MPRQVQSWAAPRGLEPSSVHGQPKPAHVQSSPAPALPAIARIMDRSALLQGQTNLGLPGLQRCVCEIFADI